MAALRAAIQSRDSETFFSHIWHENFNFHSILMTSQPPYLTWRPGTVAILSLVAQLRSDGLPVAATINTGHNVHVLTTGEHTAQLREHIQQTLPAARIIPSTIATGPQQLSTHLF